jgi:GNAT superfamily N-acetyltransferase
MIAIQVVHYRPDHTSASVTLNEDWILDGGYAIEAKDRFVLDDPDGSILSTGGVIFIAEWNGKPVGCCSLMLMSDGGYEVGKMAVASAAQGLGLGQKLLGVYEAHARSARAAPVSGDQRLPDPRHRAVSPVRLRRSAAPAHALRTLQCLDGEAPVRRAC